MGVTNLNDSIEGSAVLRRIAAGDQDALADVFLHYRSRLRRLILLRLDRRLQGRIDPSDVLQEAYVEIAGRAAAYAADPRIPLFLWLRLETGQKLLELHRRHLGAKMRNAALEVSLHRGPMPQANSASLAAQLMGRLTSASNAAIRAEMRLRLQDVLNGMELLDREVLALRHFEELNNTETAQVLGLSKSAASNRYIRALRRLKCELNDLPGFFEEGG